MLKAIPVIMFSSMSAAIYASLLVPLLARTMKSTLTNEEKTSLSCISMILLGIGEIVGSLVNGKIHDSIGTRAFALVNLCWMYIAYALIFTYTYHDTYHHTFAMTLCFFWGVQDASLTNFWRGICSSQFDSPAIAYSV